MFLCKLWTNTIYDVTVPNVLFSTVVYIGVLIFTSCEYLSVTSCLWAPELSPGNKKMAII